MAVRSEDVPVIEGHAGRVLDFPEPPGSRRVLRPGRAQIRRRRLGVLLSALIVVALVWASTRPRTYVAGSRPGAPRAVVVAEGQTLWDLAERFAPLGVDPRDYSDAVAELNDLEGTIQAGQRLRLPRSTG